MTAAVGTLSNMKTERIRQICSSYQYNTSVPKNAQMVFDITRSKVPYIYTCMCVIVSGFQMSLRFALRQGHFDWCTK